MSVVLCAVSDQPLDVAAHEAAAASAEGGASVTFCGVVRRSDHGREVVELEYQAHPSAAEVLAGIAEKFAAEPDVLSVAVSHRAGTLGIGDVALVAVVLTAHRREAFEACARLVEAVKHELPVWKRQVFADGTDEWVNCP
ncbi:MAG TPA: molybdenum cofactor biosynthesis protein MoaE [Jatrophihabitans sp.]|jgi:molybdopterin synthase catalytic subunit